jgi:Ulp1 family protease
VVLHEEDILTLQPGGLLNDNIVTGWMEVLANRHGPKTFVVEGNFLYEHLRDRTRTEVMLIALLQKY